MLVIWIGALLVLSGVLFMGLSRSFEGGSAAGGLVRGWQVTLSSLGGVAPALGCQRTGPGSYLSRLAPSSYWQGWAATPRPETFLLQLDHRIGALRRHEGCLLDAVLLHEDVGGAVDVELVDHRVGTSPRIGGDRNRFSNPLAPGTSTTSALCPVACAIACCAVSWSNSPRPSIDSTRSPGKMSAVKGSE